MPTQAYYRAHRAALAERERQRTYERRGLAVPPKKLTGRPPLDGSRPLLVRRAAPRTAAPPIPALDPHPLVDAALAQLRPYERSDLDRDMDTIARDLVGEYVLAAVEGSDPVAALVAARARYRHDRAALVYGTSLVDGLHR